jgi:hypothetical protein
MTQLRLVRPIHAITMKRHLFYTFLGVFGLTSLVTLMGVTGVIHIADGYLTPLVGAFLLELAGAVIAVFRRAEFFTDDEQKNAQALAQLREQHAEVMAGLQKKQAQREQERIASLTARLQGEIDTLTKEKENLRAQLKKLTSLKLRAWSLFNQAKPISLDTLLTQLRTADNSVNMNDVMSIVGILVEEGKIEGDTMSPGGHYRLKQ